MLTAFVVAAIQVAFARTNTGDEAFRNGNLYKALSKYHAAMAKMQTAHGTLPSTYNFLQARDGLPFYDPVDAFLLINRSRIARTYLRLAAYDEVCRWAAAAVDTEPRFPRPKTAWANFARSYHQAAHYCKAIAYEKTDNLDQAVWNMWKALKCDPGDGHVFQKHMALQKAREEEKLRQEAIIAMATAKKSRKKDNGKRRAQEKRAKGRGCVIGAGIL